LFSIISLALASWLIYVAKKNIDKANYHINQTYETIATIHESIDAISETGALSQRYIDVLQQLDKENNDQQKYLPVLRTYVDQKRPVSTIRALLNIMLSREKALLNDRKLINKRVSQRTALMLVLGRIGAFLFVVIILLFLNRDITRHKATQQKLTVAMKEAQEAKQLQEQFLANMSHEIRTPMNGIKGMTDLLLNTPLAEKQQEMAGMIKRSVNNLLVIINDILDFSKIKAGKLRIEKIDFSIKEVVTNVTSLLAHQLTMKGLRLFVTITPDVPDRLTGDPYRLNQILTNLLGNAIKFTNTGHVQVEVTLQEQSADKLIVSFTVNDTGIGIAPESLPYIFDSFSQAGQDISRRYGGTGLGLTISKQLLHLQGGDISVKSTPGKGSAFHFYLPFGYSINQVPEVLVRDAQDNSQLLVGKHFLVAEDNEINQKLIDYVLKNAGANVTMANNGAEAIDFVQKNGTFDLIIMDLQMPEMDGYAATRFIRNNLHLQTPIIAMTATAMKDEQWQCLESGMNDYMTKPFEFDELYKRIVHLLH
jgi:signal transduction histidine kinase/CheY-like chemotaxis protein